jgi:hypothetical protein
MTGRTGRLPFDGRVTEVSVAPIEQIDVLIVDREMLRSNCTTWNSWGAGYWLRERGRLRNLYPEFTPL